jgi:hypothetical protein
LPSLLRSILGAVEGKDCRMTCDVPVSETDDPGKPWVVSWNDGPPHQSIADFAEPCADQDELDHGALHGHRQVRLRNQVSGIDPAGPESEANVGEPFKIALGLTR